MLRNLLPRSIALVATRSNEPSDALHPSEAVHVRSAGPGRLEEFRLGRACARRALAELGVGGSVAVGVGDNRGPVWPAGTVGSITHCDGFCAAAVSWENRFAAIGIDAAVNRAISPGAARRISEPVELDAAGEVVGCDPAALIFSAKESIFKAWSPLTRAWLGFRDATVHFDQETGTFVGEIAAEPRQDFPWFPPLLHGRFAVDRSVVLTALVIRPESIGMADRHDHEGAPPSLT